MNEKVTDAAVETGCSKSGITSRAAMRIALEDALPHIHPAKPEAVRLRDELRERAEFEALADVKYDLHRMGDGGRSEITTKAWSTWQDALAATGKQQVGDAISETLDGVKAKLHPMEWSILMAGLSDARAAEQVGEGFDIDDVRELFEKHAKGRDLTPDTWGVSSYVDPFVDNDWNEWAAAWKAFASRQSGDA